MTTKMGTGTPTGVRKRAPKGAVAVDQQEAARRATTQTVGIYRDEAAWLRELADDRKTSIAVVLSDLIRQKVYAEYQAVLRRKLAAGPAAPPPPGQ